MPHAADRRLSPSACWWAARPRINRCPPKDPIGGAPAPPLRSSVTYPAFRLDPAPVHVRPVLDDPDGDSAGVVINSVDDPVVPPACGVEALQTKAEGVPYPLRVLSQRPVDELDHGRADLLGQPRELAPGGGRPGDRVRLAQLGRIRAWASSFVRISAWPAATSASAWRMS